MSQVEEQTTVGGRGYWRSMGQLADSPEVRALIEKEFPGYDPGTIATTSRRGFLRLMAASMALAGVTLSGCRRWPKERLAPYAAARPEIPGVPESYATVMELGGVAQPLVVQAVDGRPIKVEGNPTHPMSWIIKGKYGSADSLAQASVLQLYDPTRGRAGVVHEGKGSAWEAFAQWAGQNVSAEGLAVLCEGTSSPSVQDMKGRLLKALPGAKWYEYEPLTQDAELEGAKQAFGRAVRPVLHLDKADVAVFLDADPLMSHPAHVRYAADWSERRRSVDAKDHATMSRVYVAETAFTITGTVADVRLPVTPDRVEVLARVIAGRLGAQGQAGDTELRDLEKQFVEGAVKDLQAAKGKGLMYAGAAAPAAAHALCHAVNQQLGAVGTTITVVEDPAGDRPSHMNAIAELSKAMAGGAIKTLIILGGNPAYDAPVDTDFANRLKALPASVHLSEYFDETSRLCKWHLPEAHYLEAWCDARAWDGTASVVQPLIEPLFGGKSIIEVLAILARDQVTAGEQIVRRTWRQYFIQGADFEKRWRTVLEAGLLEGSAFKPVEAQVQSGAGTANPQATSANAFFVRFGMDSHVYDGRFANNGWLQETHDPLTKLVWDNAALVSPADASKLAIKHGDVVRIEVNDRSLEAAVFVLPGQPSGVIGLSLGYGRTDAGPIGSRLGFNSYILRATGTPYVAAGAKVTPIGKHYTLAATHEHHILSEFSQKNAVEPRVGGKGDTGFIVREATLNQYQKDHHAPHRKSHGHLSLQLFNEPHRFNNPHAWGMAVDLNTCIGCNACVTACQAENNIPVVGKEMVLMHREMHWIRIDRYFKGDPTDPQIQVVHQPMMCVHCENAPCEQVCPVAATVHDTEGLNTMVYNRCIGTRYCSNNCPYKVRRFNYFDWHAKSPRTGLDKPYLGMPDQQQRTNVDPVARLVFNPEVTVRMRGVMEKCTYCTQRIQNTKIARRNAGEKINDLEVITACAQACPTQAIVFGDLNDLNSRVRKLHDEKATPRVYDVLGELNTRPRTRYLAKIRNPAEEVKA